MVIRKIASITLAVAFILLSITGLQLSLGPKPAKNPIQIEQQQAPVKQEKSFYPKELHEWAGYAFIAAGTVHLALNAKPLMNYLKIK